MMSSLPIGEAVKCNQRITHLALLLGLWPIACAGPAQPAPAPPVMPAAASTANPVSREAGRDFERNAKQLAMERRLVAISEPRTADAKTPATAGVHGASDVSRPVVPTRLATVPSQESMMGSMLADLRNEEEIRAFLQDGLTQAELVRVGFDQVTIRECIDSVVQATLDGRSGAKDPAVSKRLIESLELYLAAKREAAIRRSAGAASCLPHVRPGAK